LKLKHTAPVAIIAKANKTLLRVNLFIRTIYYNECPGRAFCLPAQPIYFAIISLILVLMSAHVSFERVVPTT
jgi:hypothetical protein